jgi:putative FmdB family regulatory protein
MPTYEYVCRKCEHRFEKFQSITAKPIRKCPSCGKASVQRLVGAGAGIIFKGSGFYQTDYRSDSYKKGSESEKKAPVTPASEKKTETKDSNPTEKAKPAAKGKKKSA